MKFSKLDEISNQRKVFQLLNDCDNEDYGNDEIKTMIGKIINQDMLESLIENSSHEFIREECVKRICSLKYLFNLASDDSSWRIRLIAIQELLFKRDFYKSCDEILNDEKYEGYPFLDNLEDIARNDGDWKNRLVATLLIFDESILEDIACSDESKYLRVAAIFNIDNRDKLIEIIENDLDSDVVGMAAKKLDDESELIGIYRRCGRNGLGGGQNIVRKATIIRNIHDQFFLIDEMYRSVFWEVSLEASRNVHDPIVLRDMLIDKKFQSEYALPERFTSSWEDDIYFDYLVNNIHSLIIDDELQLDLTVNHGKSSGAAIEYIADPKIYNELLNDFDYDYFSSDFNRKLIFEDTLFNMALNHPDADVRYNAVLRIFDKSRLMEIIDNESDEKVKRQALWNLNRDESEFKLNTKYKFVFGEAVKSVTDESILAKIICYSKDEYLSQIALNNIEDEELLVDIACTFSFRLLDLALNRIADNRLLAKVAINAKDELYAAYAVTKINEDECLIEVLNNSPHPRCYPYAVLRIDDESVLEDIACNCKEDYLRKVATSRISSQDILKDIALNDSNYHVRMQAVKNITDESFLNGIARNDDNQRVRLAAERTIESFKI